MRAHKNAAIPGSDTTPPAVTGTFKYPAFWILCTFWAHSAPTSGNPAVHRRALLHGVSYSAAGIVAGVRLTIPGHGIGSSFTHVFLNGEMVARMDIPGLCVSSGALGWWRIAKPGAPEDQTSYAPAGPRDVGRRACLMDGVYVSPDEPLPYRSGQPSCTSRMGGHGRIRSVMPQPHETEIQQQPRPLGQRLTNLGLWQHLRRWWCAGVCFR